MNYIIEFMTLVSEFLQNAWAMLTESWLIKVGLTVFASVAIELIHMKHVQTLGIFILLVVFDLFTKWGAIAYQMLIDKGHKPEDITIAMKYWAIPVAFGEKLINSKHGRRPFINKILTYILAMLAAWLFDMLAGQNAFAANLVALYLGSNEFLSVLENMRDGGNATIGRFVDLAKSKIDAKLK